MNYLLAVESAILLVSLGFMAVYAVLECLDTLKAKCPSFVDGYLDGLTIVNPFDEIPPLPQCASDSLMRAGQASALFTILGVASLFAIALGLSIASVL